MFRLVTGSLFEAPLLPHPVISRTSHTTAPSLTSQRISHSPLLNIFILTSYPPNIRVLKNLVPLKYLVPAKCHPRRTKKGARETEAAPPASPPPHLKTQNPNSPSQHQASPPAQHQISVSEHQLPSHQKSTNLLQPHNHHHPNPRPLHQSPKSQRPHHHAARNPLLPRVLRPGCPCRGVHWQKSMRRSVMGS
jgi:hypothetical protein